MELFSLDYDEVETDAGVFFGLKLHFQIRFSRTILEPYSWGQSRGWCWDGEAHLTGMTWQGREFDRAECLKIFGKNTVADFETSAEEAAAEAA